MELSDLRVFRAVVEAGGVTRAAEQLHRVQSGVTTRIRQLERKLDTRLFAREGKRMILTPAGRRLLDYAERLLDLSAEAEAAMRDPEPGGVFRLGSMESTAATRLPAPLAELNRRFPAVVPRLRTGNPVQLSAALLEGRIDAALVAEPVSSEAFEQFVAFEEETVIVTARNHPAIDDENTVPRAMIVFEKGCPHRRLLEAWYSVRGEAPQQIIELASYHAMFGCVLAGMGAALLPKSLLETFPESGRLRCHALPAGMNRLQTLYIWRRQSGSPNIAAFAEVLQSANGGEAAAKI
jgi:DNA-binding transcriptional LysR family regulator